MARKTRKPNGNKAFERPSKQLVPHDKVLIVCEDTKSARYYLEDLVKYLQLQSARVQVMAGSSSAPSNVVNTAIKMSTPLGEDPFDQVFIVIDRDTHSTFDSALRDLKNHSGTTPQSFTSIVSYPSFEVWILYHFTYTRKPLPLAKDVIRKIKTYDFDYNKAHNNLFVKLLDKFDTAINNSQRSLKDVIKDGISNPSTEFATLIKRLKSITIPDKKPNISVSDIEKLISNAVNTAYSYEKNSILLDDSIFSHLHPRLTELAIYHQAIKSYAIKSGLKVVSCGCQYKVYW